MKKTLLSLLLISVCYLAKSQNSWENYMRAWHPSDIHFEKDTVWIATDAGLYKYNRKTDQTTMYTHGNSALPSREVINIIQEGLSSLMLTCRGYITTFENGKFKIHNYPDLKYSEVIKRDPYGNLWVSEDRIAIVRISPNCIKKWQLGIPMMSYSQIRDIKFDSSNAAWIATSYGLFRITEDSVRKMSNLNINYIATNKKRSELWIATEGAGLYHYDGKNFTQYTNPCLTSNIVLSVALDSKDNVWITQGKKILKIQEPGCVVYEAQMSDPQFYKINIDETDTVWCGTIGGSLMKLIGTTFKKIDLGNAPYKYYIEKILTDKEDSLFVETENLLYKFKNNTWRKYSNNQVSNFTIDSKGTTWVALYNSDTILMKIKKDGSKEIFDTTNSPLRKKYNIRVITTDTAGNLWASYSFGLLNYNGSAWKVYTPKNSLLPCNNIYSMTVDTGNTLWVGVKSGSDWDSASKSNLYFHGGLFSYHANTWKKCNVLSNEADIENFKCIVRDSKNNIWVIYNGLACYNGSKWKYYSNQNSDTLTPSPIPVTFIQTLFVDNQDNIWMGTSAQGVACLNPVNDTWKVFAQQNSGLGDDEANTIAQTSDGIMWFGGAGMSKYNPNIVTNMYKLDYISHNLNECSASIVDLKTNVDPGVSVYPNPFSDQVNISLTLEENSFVCIDFVDLTGRTIKNVVNGSFSVGSALISCNAYDLAAGLYLCKIKVNDKFVIRKVSVVK